MAFDFPASPANGDLFKPAGGPEYIWRSSPGLWEIVTIASAGVAYMHVGDNPPAAPASQGQMWWESDSAATYVWYDDGTSSQWCQINGTGLGEAPLDGPLYGRGAGLWKETVLKTYVDSQDALKANLTGAFFTGACSINVATTALFATVTSGNGHGVVGTPALTGNAGLLGYTAGQVHYGYVGIHYGGVYYAYYGSANAYLGSGSWGVSDGRLKTIHGAASRNALPKAGEGDIATQAVLACPVHEFSYTGDVPAPAPNEGATKFGWIAQEVEAIIPAAVADIGIPPDDLAMRAAIKGVPAPEKGSKAAGTLAEEDLSVKAINDRYMLVALWRAFQELEARVKAVEAV